MRIGAAAPAVDQTPAGSVEEHERQELDGAEGRELERRSR